MMLEANFPIATHDQRPLHHLYFFYNLSLSVRNNHNYGKMLVDTHIYIKKKTLLRLIIPWTYHNFQLWRKMKVYHNMEPKKSSLSNIIGISIINFPILLPNNTVVSLFLELSGRSYALTQKGIYKRSMKDGCSSPPISFSTSRNWSKCHNWLSITLCLFFYKANWKINKFFPNSLISTLFLIFHTL